MQLGDVLVLGAGPAGMACAYELARHGIPNLDLVGRAGLLRYNNSDHALLTGLYGARNLLGEKHDLWSLDVDGYDN